MANYAILRFSKRKAGGVASADRHNERKKSVYKSNPNIDKERSKLNYHLIKPKGTYKKEYSKRIDEAGCKVRSNSVVMVETLITASPDFINKLGNMEQERFFQRAVNFISSRVGENNIISAVVHMDETTPHMHLVFCPITEKGKLSAKDILGNRESLSAWQDQFYEYMAKEYPDLQRGIPRTITGRKHIPTYLFKQAAELSKSYEVLEKLEGTNVFNAKTVKKDVMQNMSRLLRICTSLAGKTKEVDGYISNLEKAINEQNAVIATKDSIIEERNEQNDDLYGELVGTQQRLKELQSWQQKAQQILAKIPPEIRSVIEKSINKEARNRER